MARVEKSRARTKKLLTCVQYTASKSTCGAHRSVAFSQLIAYGRLIGAWHRRHRTSRASGLRSLRHNRSLGTCLLAGRAGATQVTCRYDGQIAEFANGMSPNCRTLARQRDTYRSAGAGGGYAFRWPGMGEIENFHSRDSKLDRDQSQSEPLPLKRSARECDRTRPVDQALSNADIHRLHRRQVPRHRLMGDRIVRK